MFLIISWLPSFIVLLFTTASGQFPNKKLNYEFKIKIGFKCDLFDHDHVQSKIISKVRCIFYLKYSKCGTSKETITVLLNLIPRLNWQAQTRYCSSDSRKWKASYHVYSHELINNILQTVELYIRIKYFPQQKSLSLEFIVGNYSQPGGNLWIYWSRLIVPRLYYTFSRWLSSWFPSCLISYQQLFTPSLHYLCILTCPLVT